MEKFINIAVNADEAVGKLALIQQAAQETSSIIQAANYLSGSSFEGLTGAINSMSGIFGSANAIIGSFSDVVDINTSAIGKAIGAISEYSAAMMENTAVTTALEGARAAMSVADTIANEGIRAGFEATLDYVGALVDNEMATMAVEIARSALTIADAFNEEGIRSGIEATLEQIDALTDCEYISWAVEDARGAMTIADAFSEDGVRAGIEATLEQIEALTDNETISWAVEAARGAMEVADAFATEGVMGGVNALIEQIDQMTENETVTKALEYARYAMNAVEWLAEGGIRRSIDAVRDQISAFGDDARQTMALLNVRESMTDAEGNFCLQAAKSVALTIFSTIMKYKDKLASIKNIAMKKKEAFATKAGAKVDAVGAKAKMALTAAKPFIGPILLAAAGVALGVGIALLVRKMRQPVPLATGGVATNTTFAMIGEGRYDEAVVPLGNSPQFNSMKADIAAAVIQGMSTVMGNYSKPSGGSYPNEVVLNIDGSRLARVMLPRMTSEQRRTGHRMTLREV